MLYSYSDHSRHMYTLAYLFLSLKANFHSVQFSERVEFYDRFLLKCIQLAISNEIRST